METIRNYINAMFKDFPCNEEVNKLKEAMLESMEDKYYELIDAGKSENETIGTVIAQFGNIDELKREFQMEEKEASYKSNVEIEPMHTLNEFEAHAYLRKTGFSNLLVSFGVFLLIINVGIYEVMEKNISEGFADMLFFTLIATAVGMFIYSGEMVKKYGNWKKETFVLPSELHRDLSLKLEASQLRATKYVITGVVSFILSPAIYAFLESETRIPEEFITFIFMALIANGVALLIRSDNKKEGYETLLSIHAKEYKKKTKSIEKIELLSVVLFPLAAIIYVSVGMSIGWWKYGWIIFPICGVVVAAYSIILKMKEE